MRHMGNSGKFAVITGIVAAGLLVLTGMTLAMPVFVAFAGVLGLTYLACVLELVLRRRHVMLVLGGVCTSLAVAGALAFVGTWELSFEGQSSLIGTPLPTDDPDTYFILSAGSLAAAFAVLFTGAVWPARAPATTASRTTRRPPVRKTPARQGTGTRGTGTRGAAKQTPSRQPARKPAPRR